MPVGRQQPGAVARAQRAHGAVVRVRRSDEVVHVTVGAAAARTAAAATGAAHARGRTHRVAPQHVDGVIQPLQTVLDATLLQGHTATAGAAVSRRRTLGPETQCDSPDSAMARGR